MDDKVQLTKKGAPRKRKPKTKINYFTLETQNSILRYRESKSQQERNRIYNNEIHYAFYKLVENIIHTFKFYHTEVEDIEDLKYEVISFLLQKIHLYDESKGKAYSYFGTIAKRYLITYNKKNYSKIIDKKPVSYIDNEEKTMDIVIFNPEESKQIEKSHVILELIDYVENNMLDIFKKEEYLKVADSIMEILKRFNSIDINNKKELYVYVKEMTNVKSTTITKVINIIKESYKKILNSKLENEDY